MPFNLQSRKLTLSLIVVAWLTGCFGSSGFEAGGGGANFSDAEREKAPPCNPGFCASTPTADKVADEARPFQFDFTPTVAGSTFFINNRPSWLYLDQTATKIFGTPDAPGVVQNVEIHIYDGTNTEIIGPFDITVTGDPLAQFAWHLNNVGQKTFSTSTGSDGEDIGLLGALALGYTGTGIKIAVSDSGVEIAHEDLADNVIPGASRNYDLASPYIGNPTPASGSEGHGTAVTGLVAAKGWNSKGSRGVAPNAKFAGFYFVGSAQSLALILHQASGAFDIFNYSYGFSQCSVSDIPASYGDQLKSGVTTLRNGLGALYVQASGNDFVGDLSDCVVIARGSKKYFGNSNFDGNLTTPYTIVVGAVNAQGVRASYSSPGANLWVSAPGGEFGISSPAMLTSDMTGCMRGFSQTRANENSFERGGSGNADCKYTSTMNGTSSATPVTSGVIALMLEANPNLKWRDVKHILATTATKVNSKAGDTKHPFYSPNVSSVVYQQGWVTNAAGIPFHNWYGFGRVDAQGATEAARDYTTALPTFVETSSPFDKAWYYKSGAVNLTIPDSSATGAVSALNVRHNLIVEAVQVKLNVTHVFPSDLSVELTSPSGTKSILANFDSILVDSDFVNAVMLSNAFYGESSRGNWQLKLIDVEDDDAGSLGSWEVKVFGHVNPTPIETVAPAAPASITVPAKFASLTATPAITWPASSSGDVMRYEFSIGTASGLTNIAGWQSVGGALTTNETGLSLTNGNTYFFNVRAIDTSENISSVISDSWLAKVP